MRPFVGFETQNFSATYLFKVNKSSLSNKNKMKTKIKNKIYLDH